MNSIEKNLDSLDNKPQTDGQDLVNLQNSFKEDIRDTLHANNYLDSIDLFLSQK